jgi:hypothetical protein
MKIIQSWYKINFKYLKVLKENLSNKEKSENSKDFDYNRNDSIKNNFNGKI